MQAAADTVMLQIQAAADTVMLQIQAAADTVMLQIQAAADTVMFDLIIVSISKSFFVSFAETRIQILSVIDFYTKVFITFCFVHILIIKLDFEVLIGFRYTLRGAE